MCLLDDVKGQSKKKGCRVAAAALHGAATAADWLVDWLVD